MLHLRALIHRVRVLDVENDSDRAEGDTTSAFKSSKILDVTKSDDSSKQRDWEENRKVHENGSCRIVMSLTSSTHEDWVGRKPFGMP